MFKPLIYLLLFHVSLGILLPSLTLLNDNLIESTIVIVNLEGELESEEKETEKKIFEESVYLDYAKIDSYKSLIYTLPKNYQSVFLKSFSPPPEVY